jgi:PAS domain S-box-containing protein
MSITEMPTSVVEALSQLSAPSPVSEPSAGLWQTTILAIARRIAASVGSTENLVPDAASALAESLGFDFCGSAQPSPDGAMSLTLCSVRHDVIVPTEPAPVADQPEGSLVGFTMAKGRLTTTPNLEEETRYRDLLLERSQAQSAIACPLRSGSVSHGCILLGSQSRKQLLPTELVCIETICHLVAAALARSRAEALLEKSRYSTGVLEALDTPFVVLDKDLRLLQVNRSCLDLSGFSASDVEQRKFCSAFVTAEEESAIDKHFDQLLRDGKPCQFEARLLLKHGDECRVEWRFRRLAEEFGGVLVGTGIDVTAKSELEKQVAKLQQKHAAPKEEAPKVEAPVASTKPDTTGDNGNRRRFPRLPYPYMQRICAALDGRIPELTEFAEIECRDISAGGFSYYTDQKPTVNDFVVAFGADGMEKLLNARVVHFRPAVRNRRMGFIVGCQFTGRPR